MRDRFTTLLVVVLLALLGANVLLNFRQRAQLRALQKELQRAHEQLAARRFVEGDLLDKFEVVDGGGATRTLSARASGSVAIVVVNPECESCIRTARELRAVRTPSRTWVISLGDPASTARFAAEHQLRDVYTLAPTNFPIVRQKFSAIPQALRVENGLVTRTCEAVAACVSGP